MKVFIVIAAFNVEEHIGSVIEQLRSAGFLNLVVVDDSSNDNTLAIVKKTGVTVLHHFINRGQGAALQTGNQFALAAGADFIIHFDGDGQMQTKDIPSMLEPLTTGSVDMVLGSRYLGLSSKIPFIKKYIYFPIGRLVNLVFTGLWLTDVHCGFRAMNRHAAESIVITQDRMAHGSEILEKINTKNLRLREVPVTILYHKFGQGLLGTNGAVRTVMDLVKAKLLK